MLKLPSYFLYSALLFILTSCANTPEYKIARKGDISVDILVVDEKNVPIPYAEVWRVVSNPVRRSSIEVGKLSLEYLNRVTHRYRDFAEYATPWRPGFWPALEDGISTEGQFATLLPTSTRGKTEEIIKVEIDRPEILTVRYSAMRFGYSPQIIERTIVKTEDQLSLRITLRRDEKNPVVDAPYTREFNRLRVDSLPGSPNYIDDPEIYRNQMLAAGAAAEAVGDKHSAARIYSWVPFIPTRTNFDNITGGIRASGFTREDENSPRNIELIQKAFLLDPENSYVRMKKTLLSPPADRLKRIEALESLVAVDKSIWLWVYTTLEDLYYISKRSDDARRILDKRVELEPEDRTITPGLLKMRKARYVTLQEFRDKYVIDGNVNKADEYRRLPIMYAVRSGRVDLYDWLIKQEISKPLPTYLGIQAIDSRNPAMVRRILETDEKILGPSVRQMMISRVDLVENHRKNKWHDEDSLNRIKSILLQEASIKAK